VELFPRDNAKVHHTSQYEIVDNANPSLVIRRGDPFYLAIRLNGPYDQSRDKIRLEFMFGMFVFHNRNLVEIKSKKNVFCNERRNEFSSDLLTIYFIILFNVTLKLKHVIKLVKTCRALGVKGRNN